MQNKKSICFVLPGWVTKHTGGAEWQCYLLSEEFITRGWKVEVFTSFSKYINEKEYYNHSIKYHYYKDNYKVKLFTLFLIFIKSLKTNSKYYYLRTDAYLLRTAIVWLSKFRRIKTIYALASDEDALNKSFLDTFYSLQFKGIKYIYHFFNYFITNSFTRRSIYNFDKIICQTKTQQQILKQTTKQDSLLIRNSIKETPYGNEQERDDIILWVGNMRPIKRPEMFLKLVDEFQDSNWKFVLIGKSFKYMDLIKKVRNRNFKYLGELTYNETNKWFEKSKLLINTSLHEGFSNTFIQAWYYKTLIISLSVNPDGLLNNQKLGYCADNDFSRLNKLTLNSTQYYHKQNEILDNAYSFAKQEFDLDKNFEKLENTILNL